MILLGRVFTLRFLRRWSAGCTSGNSLVAESAAGAFDVLGAGVRGLDRSVAPIDECKSNPNELFRRVQRNSFVENHGLEPHEAVSEFRCELMPCEEGFANDED